jgi:hypothetical protein
LQTKEIDKAITKTILFTMPTCEKPLNLFFKSCFFLWYSLAKWPLVP